MGTNALADNVRVLAHSAIRIVAEDGTVAYFDPFELRETPHDGDIVFFTHAHYDHFSPEDATKVMNDATHVVCPATMANEASGIGAARIHGMKPGETLTVGSFAIEAVPAYNVQPERLNFHPQANGWLGYIVTVDGIRYYIAGDTDQNPDNEHVTCDVALIPVGGTYTMDAAHGATFIEAIRPSVAIPTHYGTAVGTADDGPAFARLLDGKISVILKMEGLA